MKSIKNALFLMAVLCVFAACKKGGPSADAEAKKFCECGQSFATASEKFTTATPEEQQGMMAEYTKAMNEATKCLTASATKNTLTGDDLKNFQDKFNAAVKAECPKLAALLNK